MSARMRATTKLNQMRLAREMMGIAMLDRMAAKVFGRDFIGPPLRSVLLPVTGKIAYRAVFQILGRSDDLSDLGPAKRWRE